MNLIHGWTSIFISSSRTADSALLQLIMLPCQYKSTEASFLAVENNIAKTTGAEFKALINFCECLLLDS